MNHVKRWSALIYGAGWGTTKRRSKFLWWFWCGDFGVKECLSTPESLIWLPYHQDNLYFIHSWHCILGTQYPVKIAQALIWSQRGMSLPWTLFHKDKKPGKIGVIAAKRPAWRHLVELEHWRQDGDYNLFPSRSLMYKFSHTPTHYFHTLHQQRAGSSASCGDFVCHCFWWPHLSEAILWQSASSDSS